MGQSDTTKSEEGPKDSPSRAPDLAAPALNINMLLSALDVNILATAVPAISVEFDDYSSSSWLATGFFIAFANSLPLYAKLSDVFGRKALFVVAIVIFLIGSGLCGGSKTMTMLIGSRVIQGIGSGGIYGLINVIIPDLVPLRNAGKHISITGAAWAIADVVGPLLGGAFSEYASWRWCFYINLCIVPFSLLTCIWTLRLLAPQASFKRAIIQLDYAGSFLLIASTTCVLVRISLKANGLPWTNPPLLGTLVGGVVGLVVFFLVEYHVKDPILRLVFLSNRTVVATFIAQLFFGANLLDTMFYVPQFFQLSFGLSPTMAGVALLPLMLGIAICSPVAGWITSHFGKSRINVVNAHTSWAEIVVVLILIGLAQGVVMSGLLHTAQVAGIGDTFGIAVFAAITTDALQSKVFQSDLNLTPEQLLGVSKDAASFRKTLPDKFIEKFAELYSDSMREGWWLMFGCAIGLVVCSLFTSQSRFQ